MGEQPADLGRAEVGIEEKPRLLLHLRLVSVGFEAIDDICGAPILPDDGVVDRLSRMPVPDQDGLALVGDADGGDVTDVETGLRHRLPRRDKLGFPDFPGVVLHPPRSREDLIQGTLCRTDDPSLRVEDDRARAAGALIQGEDE